MLSYVLICYHLLPYIIIIYYRILSYIIILSSYIIIIYYHMLSYIIICYHLLSYVFICYHMFSFVIICVHLLSYIIIYHHIIPLCQYNSLYIYTLWGISHPIPSAPFTAPKCRQVMGHRGETLRSIIQSSRASVPWSPGPGPGLARAMGRLGKTHHAMPNELKI